MFRRPIRRPLRRVQAGGVHPALQGARAGGIPPALQRANQLMASGNFAESAGIFEQFANGAMVRNGPRAPWFFLQAGHARIMAGQVPAGMAHIQQGLSLFAARGQFQKLHHAGMRSVTELKARGMDEEAHQIEQYLKATMPAGFVPGADPGMEKARPVLPTNCPACGGSIRSDEVEWVDELTAECPYCGSSVRAQR
jgi:hypothetical protein